MADKGPEASTAPSEEASRTRPTNISSTSPETAKEEQAKKASSGLMDPPVSAVHEVGTRD